MTYLGRRDRASWNQAIRDRRIVVKVSDEEETRIKRAAELRGDSVGKFLRESAFEAGILTRAVHRQLTDSDVAELTRSGFDVPRELRERQLELAKPKTKAKSKPTKGVKKRG